MPQIDKLAGELDYLRNLLVETERGEHDATLKAPRQDVIDELKRLIAEGEAIHRDMAVDAALKN